MLKETLSLLPWQASNTQAHPSHHHQVLLRQVLLVLGSSSVPCCFSPGVWLCLSYWPVHSVSGVAGMAVYPAVLLWYVSFCYAFGYLICMLIANYPYMGWHLMQVYWLPTWFDEVNDGLNEALVFVALLV